MWHNVIDRYFMLQGGRWAPKCWKQVAIFFPGQWVVAAVICFPKSLQKLFSKTFFSVQKQTVNTEMRGLVTNGQVGRRMRRSRRRWGI